MYYNCTNFVLLCQWRKEVMSMLISGYDFLGPYDPNRGFVKKVAAVYTIIDSQSNVVDVGQTDDLNNRFPNHPRQSCWERHSNESFQLYIWQESNENNRLLLESTVRRQYNPPCGEK